MIITLLLFLLGLVLLIKGGDWFVDGATDIARHFRIPELLIGATVVSIGTTLPEVMVSATSALAGHGEIAYGNAVGSIICNTALIAALTITIAPTKVSRASFAVPVLFFFAAALFYLYTACVAGHFSRATGIALLSFFLVYMTFTVWRALTLPKVFQREGEDQDTPIWKSLLFLVLGAAVIAIGADLLVDNGTLIAQTMGVPESVIALTLVALGTSLPELVTAITSLIKGHGALSLGNIIGANFFNLALVSGTAATLAPFSLPAGKTIGGYSASLVVDMPVMFTVMALVTLPALIWGKLSRWQGICLLLLYGGFGIFQFFF